MKPENIIVGQYYYHPHYPGQLYLGIGKRVMWEGTEMNSESNFTNKQLIIVSSKWDNVGQIVQNPEDCSDDVWENFNVCSIDNFKS
jgi:hypothetical protein